MVAGSPDVGVGTWGGFEPWAELIARAIVYAGGASVLEARPADDAASNPKDAAMIAFLSGMWRMKRQQGSRPFAISDGAEFSSSELFDWFFAFGVTLDAERNAIRAAIENLCSGKITTGKPIGQGIGAFRDRVFPCGDGLLLMLVGRTLGGSQRWSVKRVSPKQEEPAP